MTHNNPKEDNATVTTQNKGIHILHSLYTLCMCVVSMSSSRVAMRVIVNRMITITVVTSTLPPDSLQEMRSHLPPSRTSTWLTHQR